MNNQDLWIKFEQNMQNEGVTKVRLQKLRTMFNLAERGLKKDFNLVSRGDIEKLIIKLHNNKFTKLNREPFSGSTKSDLKKFFRQFWKWFKGDNEFYPKEVSWLKTRISKDEKPEEKSVLSVVELHKLANSFNRPIYRLLTLLLFDSGFRIQEMLAVRKRDLTWEEYDTNQKCFWLYCRESKTLTRKIPIPLFTEDVREFSNTSYYNNLKEDDLVFDVSYAYYLRKIGKNSKKVLGKHITPHALRHSSATLYAKQFDGNMNLLADRYGWSYSSSQLRTYIRRSGAYQKSGAKKVFSNEILKIKEENVRLMEKLDRVNEDLARMEKLNDPEYQKQKMRDTLYEFMKNWEEGKQHKKESIPSWHKPNRKLLKL